MVRISAREACEVTGAELVAGDGARAFEGVAIDSREVSAGGLFVAFPGERVDGNDFAARAIEAGAAAVALTRAADAATLEAARAHGAAVLRAADPEAFLQALASWWRSRLDAVVVGVTGSSGKTTTRTMTAAVLATELRTHATEGNHNNLVGCPLTILSCPADAQALVLEMGMDAPGQIETLARIARPDLAVVTNVGVAHVGQLGSRDNIACAKAEIIEGLPAAGAAGKVAPRAFLWGEDDYCAWMRDEVAAPRGVGVVTFGTGASDDARALDVTLDDAGRPSFTAQLPSGARIRASLAYSGRHNVIDALAAAAVGDACGIAPDDIAAGLASARPFRLHQQVTRTSAGYTLIDDSYNANTDSMRRAIDQLMDTAGARHVACLGDMGGLGPDEELQHAAIGAYAAGKGVDELVCVGPLSRRMASTARLLGMARESVRWADGPDEALDQLRDMLAPGDVLLVIASHATELDRVVAGLLEGEAAR